MFQDKLKLKEQIESVYERAVRNCPWSSQLWVKYLLAMERQSAQFEKMKGNIQLNPYLVQTFWKLK